MALNLVILGPPGAGKGTQAERIAASQGIPKISTGDMLRRAVAAGSDIGLRAKAIMGRGELVGDDLMIEIVRERLNAADAQKGFVLDGFPRTVRQARALDGILDGRGPVTVIDIAVPDSDLVQRLSARQVCAECGANADPAPASRAASATDRCQRCGGPMVQRADDNEQVVRQRLAVYHRDTQPLVDYYHGRPTFRAINGAQTLEQVTAELAAAIDALQGRDRG